MATPPPTTPLPPARSRGHTPLKSVDPELTPRATPPQGLNIDPRKATMPGRAPAARSQPGGQQPIPGSSQSTMRGPAPAPGGRRPSNPMPVVAGHAPQASPPRRPSEPRDAVQPATPAYGVQRPPPKDFALAATMFPSGGAPPGAMNHPNFVRRQHHETARVQFRPPRQWGGVFTVIVLLLAAAGVGVHLWFIPLDVLIAWRQPTGLSIATEPAGAKLRLDGVPLAASAPTTVTIWRDRTDHTVEATLAGYQVAREKIRYDKSASLSYVVRLLKDPSYVPPEEAAGAPTPPAAQKTGPPR